MRAAAVSAKAGKAKAGKARGALAERQAQIRQALGGARRMTGAAGAAASAELERAAEAMRQAESALRRNDLQAAEAAQSAALEGLRAGADALGAEMRARGRVGREGRSSGRDPLGREVFGAGAGDGEGAVPTGSDRVRAREIYDDILQRAQDPNRPEAEREYLRRLLDRWGEG